MQQSLLPTQRIAKLPAWSPESWQQHVGQVALRLPRPVRNSARRPVKIPYSQWALENREVTEGAHPGRWRHDFAPHTVKIMDTYCLPWVREVWLCKVEQSGGTNTMINLLMAGTDCDPGDAFILMPTEKDSNKMVSRLKNTAQASRRIKDLLSGKADDTTLEKISLTNGVTWYPAHANSPASMSSRPAKYAFGDEVDKYPALAGREADPITLIKKRGRTFRGRVKRFFCSTPAGRFIYQGMQNCHQIWEARVRCPHCGDLIKMDAEHLLIPDDATPENVDQLGVGYACNSCGVEWDEEDRTEAIRLGAAHWQCIKGEDTTRPARVGFHHRAWECLDVSLAEIAAAWLKKESGDHAARIAWANGYMAEDYEPARATDDYKEILKLCDDRPRDLVPNDAACLLLNVDTQQKGFYYELAAVSYADEKGRVKSWLVNKGQLLTFEDLKTFADRTWRNSDGREYHTASALIDSGGTRKAGAPPKHSRTKEVYAFCKANPLFKAIKGTGRKDTPVSYTTIDKWPGTSKPIPGGINLIKLDVHYYKDELAGRLVLNQDDPNAFVLYSGYTELQMESPVEGIAPQNDLTDYAKHLCAEYKDELGNWQHDKKAGRNDWGDCATYRMYHIELVSQWGLLRKEGQQQKQQRRIISKGVQL